MPFGCAVHQYISGPAGLPVAPHNDAKVLRVELSRYQVSPLEPLAIRSAGGQSSPFGANVETQSSTMVCQKSDKEYDSKPKSIKDQ
jgi:hypothetical protein